MRKIWLSGLALLCCFGFATPGFSQEKDKDAKTGESKGPEKCDAAKEDSSVTDHTIKIGGATIPYKATAGTTLLKNDKGDATGLLYTVAYTRSDVKDLATRPVSFLYNGGPGSAPMWLHNGALRARPGAPARRATHPPPP